MTNARPQRGHIGFVLGEMHQALGELALLNVEPVNFVNLDWDRHHDGDRLITDALKLDSHYFRGAYPTIRFGLMLAVTPEKAARWTATSAPSK